MITSQTTGEKPDYAPRREPDCYLYSLDAAARFLRGIDPTNDRFHFFTVDDRKSRNLRSLLQNDFNTFERATAGLLRRSMDGAGVFAALNAVDPRSRKAASITACRAVHGDFDDGLPTGGFPVEPTVIVETSPGRFQAIWLVKPDELLSPRDAGAINATIAVDYGADPQAKDVARCVRLPGFPHRKGDPFLVQVVGGCKRRHSAEALQAAFPAQPQPVRPVYEAVLDADTEEPYRRQALHDLEQAAFALSELNDNRRNMVFSMACQLAKYVSHRLLSESEVRAAFRRAAAANGSVTKYGPRFVDDAITRAFQFGSKDRLPPLARVFREALA